ncbi:MAG: glycosyltransferase [Actinomycetota bacterium]|nr:glycosyltransferase [Actinomycetota bacterium]
MPKRVLIISARMGAGHDGAAKEIAQSLSNYGFDVEIRDFLDAAPRIGRFLERTYELQLDHAQWSYEALFRIFASFKAIKPPIVTIFYKIFFPRIRRWIKELDADLVITTYPFASLVLGRARRSLVRPMKVPAYTFLTDFSVHTMWVDEGIDEYLAVHHISVRQVERLVEKTPAVSGPAVSSRFKTMDKSKAIEIRAEFGIPVDQAAALIVAGSWGVGDLKDTVMSLADAPDIFPVVICGKNKALFDDLNKLNVGKVVGWTDRMPELMAACDVVIQNAGGLTANEAFAAGVPVISYNPIKGHGLRNVIEMEAAGVSLWAKNRNELIETIHELARNPELTTRRASQVFIDDPAKVISSIYSGGSIPRRQRSSQPRPLVTSAKVAFGSISLLTLANVATNAATNEVNIASAAVAAPYSYLEVPMTSATISDPKIIRTLASTGIGAVVSGPLALEYPYQVRNLVAKGVTVVNGGWPMNSGIRLFAPIEGATKAEKILSGITGKSNLIYSPESIISSVDLAWASLSHSPVVKAYGLENPLHFKAVSGRTYLIPTENLTSAAALVEIKQVLATLNRQSFTVLPFSQLTPTDTANPA